MSSERKCRKAAGENTQIIYNANGQEQGNVNLTFDGTTLTVPAINASGLTISGDQTVPGTITTSGLVVRTTATVSGSATVSGIIVQNDATVSGVATVTSGVFNTASITGKVGFYGATPGTQPTAVADATDGTDVITQLNALLAHMRTLGLVASGA